MTCDAHQTTDKSHLAVGKNKGHKAKEPARDNWPLAKVKVIFNKTFILQEYDKTVGRYYSLQYHRQITIHLQYQQVTIHEQC